MNRRGAYRKRTIEEPPQYCFFKPARVSMKHLKQIQLTLDELEALRLGDYLGLEHLEASRRMNISRSTFTRLVNLARTKVSTALIEGCAIKMAGGKVKFASTLHYCPDCGETVKLAVETPLEDCPECGSLNMEDLAIKHTSSEEKKK